MKEFKLPAALFKAAMLCQSKNDVRYYLAGVHVTSTRIAATNGHILFINEDEKWQKDYKNDLPEKGIIVILDSTIPAKARTLKFNPISDSVGICEMIDSNLLLVKRCTFGIVDGKFPKLDKVIPSGKRKATLNIAFNAQYLALIGKVFSCLGRFSGARLDFYGDDKVACCVDVNPEFGESKFILMPMRL